MSAPKYVRVRFHSDNGRKQTVYLRDPQDVTFGGPCLRGYEVTREGDDVHGKGFDERLRLIAYSLIDEVTPMRMNLTYAELEDED